MKVLTIIKDDGITGIEYGMVEVPEKRTHNYKEQNITKEYTQSVMHGRMKAIVERQKHK